ncbi:MAG: DEAD/DEAH box helicase, partial [Propionicimonas sp.]
VTDWFNLDIQITIDGETVDFRALFTALARGESHLILESGTWFSLDRPELEQLRRVITEARQLQPDPSGRLRLRAEHAGLWEELVELGVVASQSTAWRESVSALLDVTQVPQVPLPAGLQATLRGYQEDGFRWLSFLWQARLGGILADDMGLGKTVQMLAVVIAAAERGELEHPVLVVAPTSVVGTWVSESARFAPGLRVVVVDRTARKRPESLAELRTGADVVVTSYTLLRLEEDDYAEHAWAAVFLDEAQFVKNRQARVYKAVRRLRARVKFAITGTPLENNLMDLWSLLSISAPGLFANPEVFAELYRRPIESGADPTAVQRLRRRVRPLMLRRTKEAVASELPPKIEQVLSVALAPGHRRIYDKHLAAERKKVLGLVGDLEKNRIAILASLTLLRQLSLSPALLDSSLPAQSAKIDTLVDLLEEIRAEGHRALVFSQFTSFLRLVRDRLTAEKIGYQYLDGRTRDRAARIEAFRSGTDPAFLISLKAGGFGLTLTEADYVFILDPWWNPAAELQAIDRTHRIGQQKNVNVYRLVSEDTIEEKVVALQDRKRDLFTSVIGDGSQLAAPLSAADIRGLLQAD